MDKTETIEELEITPDVEGEIRVRKAMIADLKKAFANSPRYVREAVPSLVNRFINCSSWDEAVFGLEDTYYQPEVKLLFAFFCGTILERRRKDAEEAQVLARAQKITRQIMATMDRIERRIGVVEDQHKEIAKRTKDIVKRAEKAGIKVRNP